MIVQHGVICRDDSELLLTAACAAFFPPAARISDDSRVALTSYSQNIINKADADRPPGVDTGLIERVQGERQDFVDANSAQTTESAAGQQQRADRDARVKSIIERRKKVQYAADAAWPPGEVSSAAARSEFQLPANRAYSY